MSLHAFATQSITAAALAAGLPAGRVLNLTEKDNLTLPRPRIELQFLPEQYGISGRLLAVRRGQTERIRKKELYTVRQDIAANVLADNAAWLETFSYDFVQNMPRGGNDSRGNWVRIGIERATFGKAPDKRLGNAVIEVFTKVNRLFTVTFTGRVTAEELESMIRLATITIPQWRTNNG